MTKRIKSISMDRDSILMAHGYDPNDHTLQVHVSLAEIEHNPNGNEDFCLDKASVETSTGVEVDLNIEIYRTGR